ncbi:MAG: helix-turn-helix domain-containing protein [Muricoprocola sp.]
MAEEKFMISDAAKMVAVEAHVLRFWEEELELTIGRTEQGHRYYTRENLEVFQKIKELKEQGLQLKAIKVILKELEKKKNTQEEAEKEETGKEETEKEAVLEEENAAEEEETRQLKLVQKNTEKLRQFELLVTDIVDKVVKENNEFLQSEIESAFSKEVDYMMHMQEKREEERYRKLDEVIRERQRNGKQVAAAKEGSFWKRWFR